MKLLQFLAGFFVTLAMIVLLVYETESFLRWIAAGVGAGALLFMLITFVSASRQRANKDPELKRKQD